MVVAKKVAKTLFKILIGIIIFYIFFYLINLTSCSSVKTSKNEEDYLEYLDLVNEAKNALPNIEDFHDYQDFSINYKHSNVFIWIIDTISIELEYEKNNFENEINYINSNYTFLNEPTEVLEEVTAKVKGYEFRIVQKEAYFYPKYFMMIGINKEENSIIYTFHYDSDLDYIDDLDSFIKKYFAF